MRGHDNNASCFPNSNENSALSFTAGSCCWVNGLGNNTCCQATWIQYDNSLLQKHRLVPQACGGGWPCNAQGVYVNNGQQCYGSNCKVNWARVFVR